MQQFYRLCYFEWKKIISRKSTWITLFLLIGTYVLMEAFYIFGSTYVEGEFLETHQEGRIIDIKNSKKLSGRIIDDSLLKEMQQAYSKYADSEDESYMLTEDYQNNVRPYSPLYHMLSYMINDRNQKIHTLTMNAEQLYEACSIKLQSRYDAYELSQSEREYWNNKQEKVEMPFIYQYADGYDYFISMSGVYRICMLLTFFIAICMSLVFTEEHSRKTDQVILCSKYGRAKAYFAKITAGTLFSVFATAVLTLFALFIVFVLYGMDGWSAAVQLIVGYYPQAFSLGQVCLILLAILLLSSVLISVFTMFFSELTHSNIASMAAVVASMFAARLIQIPLQYRIISQVWNFIPINLLKFDEGFVDLRLVQLFGVQFTCWQFGMILYLVLSLGLILIGKKVYCRYQVEGR